MKSINRNMPTINDARVRNANQEPIRASRDYVLYWCQMFRRLQRNHALDHAIHLARTHHKPLVIYEGLKLNPPWATRRFHAFLLQGMRDNFQAAKQLGWNYWPFVETPDESGYGLARMLAKKACAVVTDDYPAYIIPAQIRALASRVDVAVFAIDSNSVVPLSLLGKSVGAAAHLRPRIHKLFADCWPHRADSSPSLPQECRTVIEPDFQPWTPPTDITDFVNTLPLDASVPVLTAVEGGSVAGRKNLASFLKHKLHRYAEERNDPNDPEENAASGLSPWLHYGHISIEEVVEDALGEDWKLAEINHSTRNKDDFFCRDANVNSFLDEAVTWRDVGYQWHWGRLQALGSSQLSHSNISCGDADSHFNFETMDFTPRVRGTLETVLPGWALKSLLDHAADRRDHLYSLEEFEQAKTHDELWNAAQSELVHSGRIHNYLRMLWAKKVLEWSPSPEEAYNTLETLNNKYAIDGRDPNSYTGILWSFGLFDRPWAPERRVFGNIRYMSSDNTARKFKLQGYYDYVNRLRGQNPSRLF